MEQPEFDPLMFLRLADDLVTDEDDEAILRTAVGRAYYAVFLIARSKVDVRGRHNVHERVRQAISPMNDRVASLLGGMGYMRLVADYEPVPEKVDMRNWRRNWEQARRNATRVLDALSKLPDFVAEQTDEQA